MQKQVQRQVPRQMQNQVGHRDQGLVPPAARVHAPADVKNLAVFGVVRVEDTQL